MGSVCVFDEDGAVAKFDRLVQAGIIHDGPSSATHLAVDGFAFEFRLRPSWSTKPRIPAESLGSAPAVREETFGPASDIRKSHPDQVLGVLSGTHLLALNIYPSSRPHYLLLTLDSTRRQDEPLDAHDMHVAWSFLHSLRSPGEYYVTYNCAAESGCSRQHKHLQVLKRPASAGGAAAGEPGGGGARFFPDVEDAAGGGSGEQRSVKVPYRYFLHRFARPGPDADDNANTAEDVYRVYSGFLERCRRALGRGPVRCPHNLILVREWLLVIPRRYPENEAYMGLLPNGAGMMGMVSSVDQAVVDMWMTEGPSRVLAAFGLPPDTDDR